MIYQSTCVRMQRQHGAGLFSIVITLHEHVYMRVFIQIARITERVGCVSKHFVSCFVLPVVAAGLALRPVVLVCRCLSTGPSPTAVKTAHEGAVAAVATAAATTRTKATTSGDDNKRTSSRGALSFAGGAGSASSGVACFSSTNFRQSARLASRRVDDTTRRSKATDTAAEATTTYSRIRGGGGSASGGKRTSNSADGDIFYPSGFSGGSRQGANNATDLSLLRVVPSSRCRSFGAPALLETRDTAASDFARVCKSSGRRWRDDRVKGRGWGLNSGMPEGVCMSWRSFASASSPPEPEQYLRYVANATSCWLPGESRLVSRRRVPGSFTHGERPQARSAAWIIVTCVVVVTTILRVAVITCRP